MNCIVCRIAEPLEHVAENYAVFLFKAISPYAIHLFEGFVGMWVLYQIIYKGIVLGELEITSTIKQFCIFAVILTILRTHHLLWEIVYNPLGEFVKLMVKLITQTSTYNYETSHDKGLLVAIDEMLQQIIVLGASLSDSWSPLQIGAAIPIMLVYILLGAIAVAFALEYILAAFLVASFSPVLLIAVGFDVTKLIAIRALQVILGGVLTVIFSTIAMSLTLMAAKELFYDISINGNLSNMSIKNFAYSRDYIALLILGMISILSQIKARMIAFNMIRSIDGGGIAGVAKTIF